jgi:hypothetical protein
MFRPCIFAIVILTTTHGLHIRDDGRYATSPLKSWFEHLSSKKGLCCSFADGVVVEDPDWMPVSEGAKPRVQYRVRINGPWIDVPDDAVITELNPIGKAMVWVVMGDFGMSIRCFMPGGMS